MCKASVKKGRYDSPTQCMMELHWLLVRQRVEFKILVLTCKCLHNSTPEYLKELIVMLTPIRASLRSGSGKATCLLIPKTKCKTFAERSFSVAAPTLWNSLPDSLRLNDNLNVFKKRLKTLLFKQAYTL